MHFFLLPFTDPVFRSTTLGCMLLCIAAALVGVFTLLRRQPLIGEVISHAAYPGVIFSLFISTALPFDMEQNDTLLIFLCLGGIVSSFLSVWLVDFMQKKLSVPNDAALCFTLALFFGIGVALVSQAQFSHPSWYRFLQTYLYGQTATLRDIHLYFYAGLTALIAFTILLFYKEFQLTTFDPLFSMTIGLPKKKIDTLFSFLLIAAIVIGVHAVGVVLMSAMLIAPAITARQFSLSLGAMLLQAASYGALSGYLGSLISIYLSSYLENAYPNQRLSIPTGPAIVLVATILCFLALIFSPTRGVFFRIYHQYCFQRCLLNENILKTFLKFFDTNNLVATTFKDLNSEMQCSSAALWLSLKNLKKKKFVEKNSNGWKLTECGLIEAKKITYLHTLWQMYLSDGSKKEAPPLIFNAEQIESFIKGPIEADLLLKREKIL